jgi:hypothetical protein
MSIETLREYITNRIAEAQHLETGCDLQQAFRFGLSLRGDLQRFGRKHLLQG